MAIKLPTSAPGIKLQVASAEVKRQKAEGPLYYILPSVLVIGVLAFCYTATPPVAAPASAESSMDDFAETSASPASDDLSDMLN